MWIINLSGMEIKLKQEEHYRYFTILKVLASITDPQIKPFCNLRNRELELFSIFLYLYNEKYASIPEPQRNQIIFSYQTRAEICEMLGDVSFDVVYNLALQLRKNGLITKTEISKKYLIPKLTDFKLKFL